MNQSPGPGLEAKVIPACHNYNKQTGCLVIYLLHFMLQIYFDFFNKSHLQCSECRCCSLSPWRKCAIVISVAHVKRCQVAKLSSCQVWSLRDAEQLLFSFLCSKVTYVKFSLSRHAEQLSYAENSNSHTVTISHSHSLILSFTLSLWTPFVFMCMLKNHCL